MKGIDLSNFQPVPSANDCVALVAAGFTFAVVGLQQPDHAVQQIAALRANGIAVDDCYLESNRVPALPDVSRVWVAVESGSGFETEADIDAALAYIAAQGKQAGIYTSPYQIAVAGLGAAFAGKYAAVPQWIAAYDGDDASVPAGAAMKQYSGSGQIPGLAYQLDLDYRPDVPAWAQQPINPGGDDVQLQTLNQTDAIAAFNLVASRLGHEITGDAGENVAIVTDPPPPPGYTKYQFTLRDV